MVATKKTTKSVKKPSKSKNASLRLPDVQSMQKNIKRAMKNSLNWIRQQAKYFSRKTQTFAKTVVSFVRNIPHWLKSRPTAIKKWIKEDKKKKKYRSFHLQKRIKPEPRYIPSSGSLVKESFRFLWRHKRVFLAIICIHALIYFIFLNAPSQGQSIQTIRDSIKSVLGEGSEKTLTGTFATLGAVLTSPSGGQTGAVTAVTILIMSLVYVWAIRQLSNRQPIKARDAYYQGLAPLLSSIVVLVIISIQLIPFAIASFVYSTARSGSLFASGFEDLSFFIMALLFGLLSFYLMTSSVIGFYVVTLPGMYPMKALRAAKKLVQFQRLKVFRRIVALPLFLGATYIIILLLAIRFLSDQTFLVAQIAQLLVLPFIHVYLYKLYRSLI